MIARNLLSIAKHGVVWELLFLALIWPVTVLMALFERPVGALVLLSIMTLFVASCVGLAFFDHRFINRRPRTLTIDGDAIVIRFGTRVPFRIGAKQCRVIRNWSYFDPTRLDEPAKFGDVLVVPGALTKVEYIFFKDGDTKVEELLRSGATRRPRLDFYMAVGAAAGAILWIPLLWLIIRR